MNSYIKIISMVMLLTLSLLLYGCNDSTNKSDYPSKAQLESLGDMLGEVVTEFDAPGASMTIKFDDGTIFNYSTGFADRESEIPLEIDQCFRIGSATKTFTAKATKHS
jgi:CubicO group peptidase (beta-lactamase class C family)